MCTVLSVCLGPAAGPPSVPASSSCLHQQSEEERGAAAGPENVCPPAAAAALPGAQHGHLRHLHALLPPAAASGAHRQHMGACLSVRFMYQAESLHYSAKRQIAEMGRLKPMLSIYHTCCLGVAITIDISFRDPSVYVSIIFAKIRLKWCQVNYSLLL